MNSSYCYVLVFGYALDVLDNSEYFKCSDKKHLHFISGYMLLYAVIYRYIVRWHILLSILHEVHLA